MSKEQTDLHKLVADFRKEFFEMKVNRLRFLGLVIILKSIVTIANIFIKGTHYSCERCIDI